MDLCNYKIHVTHTAGRYIKHRFVMISICLLPKIKKIVEEEQEQKKIEEEQKKAVERSDGCSTM